MMTEKRVGRVVKVAGPVVVAEGMAGARMYDVVRVGALNLIGEIVELRGDTASIQVYEETTGIGPGEPVVDTEAPLSVELGPGLIESIYDGIQRPLDDLVGVEGSFMSRGSDMPGLDRKKKWHFKPTVGDGTKVGPGDIIGEVKETTLMVHKIMIPPGVSGTISGIREGDFTVEETVGTCRGDDGATHELKLMQRWPVRNPRPIARRLAPEHILVSGQRVIDTFFPISKGGTACVPGPFGTGKTVVQHQLAKWVDADVVVYVGCGERGNEMTDVPSPTRRTCRWPRARRPSIPASRSPSTTGTWATTSRSWQIPRPAGRRRCARYPAGWRKCRPRRASRRTFPRGWPPSTSGRGSSPP